MDSSAYLALSDRSEGRHSQAAGVLRLVVNQRWSMYTTNFIVAETHALALSRFGRSFARRLLHDIDSGRTLIERITPDDEQVARKIIDQYQDKDFSLTDATSFAVFERLGLTAAFTFDSDFQQYGLTVLRPTQAP